MIDTLYSRDQLLMMAETVTLELIVKKLECAIADHAEMREHVRVLTAIVLRHENTLNDILEQIRAMASQHQRFNDRLRRLEEQPAGCRVARCA